VRSARIICLVLLRIVLLEPSTRIHAQTTIRLNSQATYLLTYSDPDAVYGAPIDLSWVYMQVT